MYRNAIVRFARGKSREGQPLTISTTRGVASFKGSFYLRTGEGSHPPGDYNVFFKDQVVRDLSRVAYRRVSTILQTPSISSPQDHSRLIAISETDLEIASIRMLT